MLNIPGYLHPMTLAECVAEAVETVTCADGRVEVTIRRDDKRVCTLSLEAETLNGANAVLWDHKGQEVARLVGGERV